MKLAKHTVEGAVGTRKSPRTYTHAVVAFYDHDAAWRAAPGHAKYDIETNWEYYQRCASKQVGDQYSATHNFPITQESIDNAKAFFAEYGTDLRIAIARKLLQLQVRHELNRASAPKLPVVLQWSMSGASAYKACGTWAKRGYREVRVLPVTRLMK